MAASKKEFTDEEKRALGAAGLTWRLWEPVYRCPASIIIRNSRGEVRLVDVPQNGRNSS
jgi:hypothetical protein